MGELRVTAGNDFNSLDTVVQVNRFPVPISNDLFEGLLIVRILNFDESFLPAPTNPAVPSTTLLASASPLDCDNYFKDRSRQFSFQIEGSFKQNVNGDDLFWDISFPYRLEGLPFFTPMVVKALQYLDPATEVDFYAKEQYVRSSILTMMNSITAWKPAGLSAEDQAVIDEDFTAPLSATHGTHRKQTSEDSTNDDVHSDAGSIASTNGPPAPPAVISRNGSTERVLHPETLTMGVQEDLAIIISGMRKSNLAPPGTKPDSKQEPPRCDVAKRRKFFLAAENRKRVTFTPDVVYAFESFNPNMVWTSFEAKLPAIGALGNIDIKRLFPIKRVVRVRMCSKDGKTTYLGMELELVKSEDGSSWSLASNSSDKKQKGSKGSKDSLRGSKDSLK
ncbi:hypothetical protein HKX48_008550 [Thoreauomyces humboldtii]|nr:hypothetical protein HKX48_008550 [Thoreauomyces humboldtii]